MNGVRIWEQLGQAIDEVHISEGFAKQIANGLNEIERKAHTTIKRQITELKRQETL